MSVGPWHQKPCTRLVHTPLPAFLLSSPHLPLIFSHCALPCHLPPPSPFSFAPACSHPSCSLLPSSLFAVLLSSLLHKLPPFPPSSSPPFPRSARSRSSQHTLVSFSPAGFLSNSPLRPSPLSCLLVPHLTGFLSFRLSRHTYTHTLSLSSIHALLAFLSLSSPAGGVWLWHWWRDYKTELISQLRIVSHKGQSITPPTEKKDWGKRQGRVGWEKLAGGWGVMCEAKVERGRWCWWCGGKVGVDGAE